MISSKSAGTEKKVLLSAGSSMQIVDGLDIAARQIQHKITVRSITQTTSKRKAHWITESSHQVIVFLLAMVVLLCVLWIHSLHFEFERVNSLVLLQKKKRVTCHNLRCDLATGLGSSTPGEQSLQLFVLTTSCMVWTESHQRVSRGRGFALNIHWLSTRAQAWGYFRGHGLQLMCPLQRLTRQTEVSPNKGKIFLFVALNSSCFLPEENDRFHFEQCRLILLCLQWWNTKLCDGLEIRTWKHVSLSQDDNYDYELLCIGRLTDVSYGPGTYFKFRLKNNLV